MSIWIILNGLLLSTVTTSEPFLDVDTLSNNNQCSYLHLYFFLDWNILNNGHKATVLLLKHITLLLFYSTLIFNSYIKQQNSNSSTSNNNHYNNLQVNYSPQNLLNTFKHKTTSIFFFNVRSRKYRCWCANVGSQSETSSEKYTWLQ